jgi:hypothetical protein
MWRWRMSWRALAATTLRKTFLYRIEIRESISNHYIILKGEKSPVVVPWVKGSYYTIKRGSS